MDVNKNLTKLITRGLVCGYLVYLAILLIRSSQTSSHPVLFMIIGILFIVAVLAYVVYTVRAYIMGRKKS